MTCATVTGTPELCALFRLFTGTDVPVGVPFTTTTSDVPAGSTIRTWPDANTAPAAANGNAAPPMDTELFVTGSAHVHVGAAVAHVIETVPATGT